MSESPADTRDGRRTRKQRSDGARSRDAILREAARLATVEGMDGLSIGRLADAVGMSKSGLFAHFGSKQDLQLATIETANALFAELVVEPASTAPSGVERLRHLTEAYLGWIQSPYPGGCFFASVAAEMDTRPGAVRDRVVEFLNEWLHTVETAVRDARAEGAIDSAEDVEQLTFEIEAHLLLANTVFVITHDAKAIERARKAIESRLAAAAPS